jgi:2-dehydro-3-deoxyphosphogluconate aldolase / (4S)-4-hydroxy-2-oxoglutarate aldolase
MSCSAQDHASSGPGATAVAIEAARLIPILRSHRPDQVLAALSTLIDAGAGLAEISMRAPHALSLLGQAAQEFGDRVLMGAGTVRTPAEAEQAIAAGASFLVSPDLNTAVVAVARRHAMLHLPGVFSPTELAQALDGGACLVKLFPAGRLGPFYVRDLLAPFPEARLVPTGGINARNAQAFLDAGAVAVAVGSDLVNDATIGDPDQLHARFREFDSVLRAAAPHENRARN